MTNQPRGIAATVALPQQVRRGDSYANCDASTTAPVINVLDFSCFLNKFAPGCP